MLTHSRRLVLASVLLIAAAASACSRPPSAHQSEVTTVPDSARALVESVELAHQVAPGETLQVRLRGVVGPDGSWALEDIAVQRSGDRVVVEPRVRRVAGDAFIQMVIPLDAVVPVVLEAGTWKIEVLGRGAPPRQEIVVAGGAGARALPSVVLTAATATAVDGGVMLPVRAQATIADGFIERLEVRGFGNDPTLWRDPGTALAEGASLGADFGVLRPPGDPARRIEARARDGQGAWSPVAVLELPARASE